MVTKKLTTWLIGVLTLGLLGTSLWGYGQFGKAKAQARALDAVDARLEVLEANLEKVELQVRRDKAQAESRHVATQAALKSAATVKDKLNATPALTLSSTDADSLREHTDALNERIRAARELP